MALIDNYYLDYPPELIDYCHAHAKTALFTSPLEAHITTNIGIIAGLLGNTVKVKLKAGYELYPNLYSYVIGESGQSKSGYLRPALKVISKIQIDKNEKYKEEKNKRFINKKKSDEENKQRKKDGLEPVYYDSKSQYPDGVFNCEYPIFTMDFTIEGLQEDAALMTNGNIFVVRDELTGTFKTFNNPGRQNDIPFLNEAYEQVSSTYKVTRKMKTAKIPLIYNLCSNILGGIQRSAISKILNSYTKDGYGDAFFARFQNICILPLEKYKQDPVPVNPDNVYKFERVLTKLIENIVKFSKQKPIDYSPYIFNLDKEAEEEYMRYAYSLGEESEKNNNNLLFKEYIQKSATFALKIALIFHILNQPFDCLLENYQEKISFETIKKAIKYVNNKIETAKVLFNVGEDVPSDVKLEAEDIYNYVSSGSFYKKYIKTGWSLRSLKRTASKTLPRKNNNCIDEEKLESLLDYLEDQGKILSFTFQHPANKKNITTYSILPEKAFKADREALEKTIASLQAVMAEDSTQSDKPKLTELSGYTHEKVERKQIEVVQYPTKEESIAHIEKLKSSVDVREYVKQHIKLDSKGIGLCPFHDDKNPSLSVKSNLFKCFACDAKGSIIDFIMRYNGTDLPASIKMLESYTNIRLEPKAVRLIDKIAEEATLSSNEAPYLKNRLNGHELSLNDSILYSRSVYYSEGSHKANYPAMLAQITNSKGDYIGLQRTYLNDDMSAKRDLGNLPNKKIIGNLDNGYVNLIDKEENDTLIIGEGIETVLSLYIMLKDKNHIMYEPNLMDVSVYANLSSVNLPDLPKRFTKILIAQDSDIAGTNYAQGMREKYKDRETKIYSSWEGNDFNDLLTGNY
jgi:hypothetical protein